MISKEFKKRTLTSLFLFFGVYLIFFFKPFFIFFLLSLAALSLIEFFNYQKTFLKKNLIFIL